MLPLQVNFRSSAIGRRGIRRVFEPAVLRKLALISLARSTGFSLEEIAILFGTADHPVLDREMLLAKADEIDGTITELSIVRDELRKAAACPAPSHLECPNFRARLKEAAEKPIRQRTIE